MYTDRKVRDLEFAICDEVLLKTSPMKGVMRFGKRGKVSLRYIGPFEILDRVGDAAYDLALPPGMAGVHPVFHVSMLKKYHTYGSKVGVENDASVKVQWRYRLVEEDTWENKPDMRSPCLQLFVDSEYIESFSRRFLGELLVSSRCDQLLLLVADSSSKVAVSSHTW
ncbi:uncharacterized protein LOC132612869 [Lycium barbarum]|uniref:uncharacterized protein LOC132612869 n=1 Tax=Lycium barbarum TaxID=112863 RepID=UPI00293EB5C4|nr:uncharacterized protein LOC132612869 [Lycium barbarum]